MGEPKYVDFVPKWARDRQPGDEILDDCPNIGVCHNEPDPAPAVTSRDELKRILRDNLALFTAMGCQPDSDPVVSMLADYIIALAGHIEAGRVRFEGQEQ